MNHLDTLRTKLSSAFELGLRHPEDWTDPKATERMVTLIRERHDGPGSQPDPATVSAAVAHFRKLAPHRWRGDVQREQNMRQGVHQRHADRFQITRWQKDRKASAVRDQQYESLATDADQIRRPIPEARR